MKKPIKLNRCEEIISSSYGLTDSTNELCLTVCYADKQDWGIMLWFCKLHEGYLPDVA